MQLRNEKKVNTVLSFLSKIMLHHESRVGQIDSGMVSVVLRVKAVGLIHTHSLAGLAA